MDDSVWTGTVARLREKVSGSDPVPAGVCLSAVTASLALALVAKVLRIAGRRISIPGDLLDATLAASERLSVLADSDVHAFYRYLAARRSGDPEAVQAAVRETIEVPMAAARMTVRGLQLCADAARLVRGSIAADVVSAASLLSGALRAMLQSAESNVAEMHTEPVFSNAIQEECRDLERAALAASGMDLPEPDRPGLAPCGA